MKPRHRLEYWVAILTPLVCVIISILHFSGALENVHWLASRISTMTLLAVGALGLFLTIDRRRLWVDFRLVLQERNQQLLDELRSTDADLKTNETIHQLWKEREPEIERVFRRIESDSDLRDQAALITWLGEETKRLVSGELSDSELRFPWDFTLAAISPDGTFIYHPTRLNISTRRRDYPYQRIIDEKQGHFIWLNERKSEQMNALVPDRSFSCHRLTKIYFKCFSRLNAIVIFESHITLLNQLPRGAFREHA